MEKVILVTVETVNDDDDDFEDGYDVRYAELLAELERNDCVVAYTVRDGGIG